MAGLHSPSDGAAALQSPAFAPLGADLRAGCGRADLLRALWLAEQNGRDAGSLAELAGYVAPAQSGSKDDASGPAQPNNADDQDMRSGGTGENAHPVTPVIAGSFAPPRPKARFWAVTERVALETGTVTSSRVDVSRVLTLEELLGAPDATAPQWNSIVPKARLMPALKRSLPATRRSGLDEAQLVVSLAHAKNLRRLPRRRRKGWAERLLLVLDLSDPLQPYHTDMQQLAVDLRRWIGRSNVAVRVIHDERQPGGLWQEWHGDLETEPPLRFGRGWDDCCGNILLLSELGLYAQDGGAAAQAWSAHLHALRRQGASLQIWCPLPLGQPMQSAGATMPPIPVAHWSAASRMRLQRLPSGEQHRTPGRLALAQQLRTRLAFAVRVEPGLLRAMRHGMGREAEDAGLEHLVWAHADMTQHATVRAIKPARLAHYRQDFSSLPEPVRLNVLDIMSQQRLSQRPLLAHIETLAWAAHASAQARASRQAQIDMAHDVITRFAHKPWQVGELSRASMANFMARFSREADEATRAFCSPAMSRMQVALQKERHGEQELSEILPGLAVADMETAIGQPGKPQCFWLALDDVHGWLMLTQNKPEPCRSLHPQEVWLSALAIRIGNRTTRFQKANEFREIELACLPWGEERRQNADFDEYFFAPPMLEGTLEFITGSERIRIEEIQRPAWALEWARDSQGLYALAPNPFGAPLRVDYPLPAENSVQLLCQTEIIYGSESFYSDLRTLDLDAIGLIASVRLNGNDTQAFRYIAPGRFVMGSPPDEVGRSEAEGPQHWVEISEGFWLADTACTQGWWQAVVGDNPSGFNQRNGGSDSHPVEQVSWNAVQGFLTRLQTILPACYATLPTEAEWEYACRAGSTTPFSFGANISTDQVNFNGNKPYNGAPAGQYRESSVAVNALPANDWGLYQMHGNVWEWCADTWRNYSPEVVRDPGLSQASPSLPDGGNTPGPEEAARALRGGCWFSFAQGARSAYRNHDAPGRLYDYIGFRLALRSGHPADQGPSHD